jgi:hypothetical protein
MSLENAILTLAAAIEKLAGAGASAPAPAAAPAPAPAAAKEKAAPAKAKPAAYEAKYSFEQMQGLMNDVKTKLGVEKAKEIRDTVGKVAKLAEITDPKTIDAVAEAAEAALAEGEDGM